MIQIKIFAFNPLGTNCIVVWDDGGDTCAVADPGIWRDEEAAELDAFLQENSLTPDAILLTHGHFDHVWGVAALVRKRGCPVYMHPADGRMAHLGTALFPQLSLGRDVERFDFIPLTDGRTLEAGGLSWEVIATPGHSPGSVSFYCADGGVLLSGDTLLSGSIGRSDLEGGDYDALIHSVMDRLMGLPGEVEVIPGHGPATSIGREAMTNPFLIPFNEPDTDWWNDDPLSLDGR